MNLPGRFRRLLILACSARKHQLPAGQTVPAWELYDGQIFRVCKRLQREGQFPRDVDVLILSAAHGVVPPDHQIGWYDQRMIIARAEELRSEVAARLTAAIADQTYAEVYLAMGRTYALAVRGSFPSGLRIIDGADTIGRMQARLRGWLIAGGDECS
jgi:hypothetical protein